MDDEVRAVTLNELERHVDNETVPSIELLRQAEAAGLCTLARDENGTLVVTQLPAWADNMSNREKSKKKPAKKKAAAKK